MKIGVISLIEIGQMTKSNLLIEFEIFTGTVEMPIYFENFDLENIHSPIKVDSSVKMLYEAGYDKTKIELLRTGYH